MENNLKVKENKSRVDIKANKGDFHSHPYSSFLTKTLTMKNFTFFICKSKGMVGTVQILVRIFFLNEYI